MLAAIFLLPVTVLVDSSLAASADFGTLIDFLKNLAIIGGLLIVVLWECPREVTRRPKLGRWEVWRGQVGRGCTR